MINGEQIHSLRLKLGETQVKFAKRFGVHYTTVLRWERGGVKSSHLAMARIYEILNKAKAESNDKFKANKI